MLAAAKQPEVVLLTDGRIVTGVVSEEDGMIVVTQSIGTMKFPKRKVERVFASIHDVYEYKLKQFPENDFDERINLAKWCLAQKMEAEARQQLEAILQRSPKHPSGQGDAHLARPGPGAAGDERPRPGRAADGSENWCGELRRSTRSRWMLPSTREPFEAWGFPTIP